MYSTLRDMFMLYYVKAHFCAVPLLNNFMCSSSNQPRRINNSYKPYLTKHSRNSFTNVIFRMYIITARQRNCYKVMISVESVNVSQWPLLGFAQICSLWNTIVSNSPPHTEIPLPWTDWKASGWPATEWPSCWCIFIALYSPSPRERILFCFTRTTHSYQVAYLGSPFTGAQNPEYRVKT